MSSLFINSNYFLPSSVCFKIYVYTSACFRPLYRNYKKVTGLRISGLKNNVEKKKG